MREVGVRAVTRLSEAAAAVCLLRFLLRQEASNCQLPPPYASPIRALRRIDSDPYSFRFSRQIFLILVVVTVLVCRDARIRYGRGAEPIPDHTCQRRKKCSTLRLCLEEVRVR